ncbi:RsmD family RNA methyltransferase [Aestuariimicrobium kwangyangense]|uniref:RsmD family RNA methyltransferase n=1 Tax=Aestuariimicrobium kwangyangense TaxID=396389 RepID=UPI0003B64978|nr:RsmD family RNA methyltransferase [Aestuariimicrobium kwangyangense]
MSRIIAGRAGGRRLQTPAGDRTRPTTDRVREAFFSSLAAWNGTGDGPGETHLSGLAFLDLFAGSGGVGLEAASRGAGPVVLVESDARTAHLIQRNAKDVGLDVTVRAAKAETYLAGTPPHRFDVAWADPPYSLPTDHLEDLLARVRDEWLLPDGVMVVERARRSSVPQLAGCETWTRPYGETTLVWIAPLEAADATEPSPPATQETP